MTPPPFTPFATCSSCYFLGVVINCSSNGTTNYFTRLLQRLLSWIISETDVNPCKVGSLWQRPSHPATHHFQIFKGADAYPLAGHLHFQGTASTLARHRSSLQLKGHTSSLPELPFILNEQPVILSTITSIFKGVASHRVADHVHI